MMYVQSCKRMKYIKNEKKKKSNLFPMCEMRSYGQRYIDTVQEYFTLLLRFASAYYRLFNKASNQSSNHLKQTLPNQAIYFDCLIYVSYIYQLMAKRCVRKNDKICSNQS